MWWLLDCFKRKAVEPNPTPLVVLLCPEILDPDTYLANLCKWNGYTKREELEPKAGCRRVRLS